MDTWNRTSVKQCLKAGAPRWWTSASHTTTSCGRRDTSRAAKRCKALKGHDLALEECQGDPSQVIEVEAGIVRMVFESYTSQGLSINAIARLMNRRQIPARNNPQHAGSGRRCGAFCEIPPTKAERVLARRRSGRGRKFLGLAATQSHARTQQCKPETASPGLDRDSSSRSGQRSDVCSGTRTAAEEQASFFAPHDRTDAAAGNLGM